MASNINFDPPLLNSSSPWATSLADLKSLYDCPFTGAVTTRTSLIGGFRDTSEKHQHCFFSAGDAVKAGVATSVGGPINSVKSHQGNSSLNTYGYSPVPLRDYLSYIKQLTSGDESESTTESATTTGTKTAKAQKLIIVSVTGTPKEISTSYSMIHDLLRDNTLLKLAMEINLSCPNIAGKPPPAYDPSSLTEYLHAVQAMKKATTSSTDGNDTKPIPIGIKLPPYTYQGQFDMVIECLRTVTSTTPTPENEQGTKDVSVIDFITSTNTLGSSLVLDQTNHPALQSEAGTGIGGMAGASIHGLSLGNIATLRRLLDQHDQTKRIFLIGVGGVCDKGGYDRMRSVGANAVGVATALGRDGVAVFEKIATG